MFDNEGHWIDDPLAVINANPDFSGLGMNPIFQSNRKTKNMEKGSDWREKCCNQCKYKFVEYNGKQLQCGFSKCTDEDVAKFNERNGCQGIREYLETGIFPERAKKTED